MQIDFSFLRPERYNRFWPELSLDLVRCIHIVPPRLRIVRYHDVYARFVVNDGFRPVPKSKCGVPRGWYEAGRELQHFQSALTRRPQEGAGTQENRTRRRRCTCPFSEFERLSEHRFGALG